MKNMSIWLKGIKYSDINASLNTNIETDVLIIGGGITGISTAFNLKDSKLKVTLVDANKVGHGVTSKTTGKLTYLQDCVYSKITNIYDNDTALKYYYSQRDAIEIVKDNIVKYNIHCNFESNSSYLFASETKEINKMRKEENFFIKNKLPYKRIDHIPANIDCKYGIKVDNTAVFNPVKYVLELKRICKDAINIYENTEIIKIEKGVNKYIAYTKKNKIEAKYIVLACHYPFNLVPLFPFKTYMEKSYLCAGICKKNKMFNAINVDKKTKSIRYYSDNNEYLVYVGESKRLDLNMKDKEKFDSLLWKMNANFCSDIRYYWSNYDLITLDGIPIVGKYNKQLLIATGFNTWGMTNGVISGKIISDILLHRKNKYEDLFDPKRKITVKKTLTSFLYSINGMVAFIKSKIIKSPTPSNVKIVNRHGTKYGIYTDENNKEHIVYNTCPHMKCNLSFNSIDKTWDCPCHGSRFDVDGKVVKGPSTKSIKIE